MSQSFTLPPLLRRDGQVERISRFLLGLAPEKAWRVIIEEAKPRRSHSQNALLWALYGDIIEKGGEAMRGWDKDDLHEFFLIEHFGAEKVSMFGRVKLRPLKRTSGMNKQDFTDHIHFIASFMNERGVYLELPEAA